MDRIAILRQYIKDDPSDAFVKYALALELVKKAKENEAEDLFSVLHERHADYLPAYYHYGKLLERKGKTGLAIEIYRTGLSVASKSGNEHAYSEIAAALDMITND